MPDALWPVPQALAHPGNGYVRVDRQKFLDRGSGVIPLPQSCEACSQKTQRTCGTRILSQSLFRRCRSIVKLSPNEIGKGPGRIHDPCSWVTGTESLGAAQQLKRRDWILDRLIPSRNCQGHCRIWIQAQRAIEKFSCAILVHAKRSPRVRGHPQYVSVFPGQLDRAHGKAKALDRFRLQILRPPLDATFHVTIGCKAKRWRVAGIDGEGLFQAAEGRRKALLRKFVFELLRAQEQVICIEICRRLVLHPLDLDELQLRLDRTDYAFGHAILQIENVAHFAVEAIGPDVGAGRSINELPREPKTMARAPNASLQHIADTKLAPNLTDINDLAFVGEGRVACDDEQPVATRERGDDVLGHAVGKIVLLGI